VKKIFIFLLFSQIAFGEWKNLGFRGESPSCLSEAGENILVGTAKGLFLGGGDWKQVLYGKKVISLASDDNIAFVGTDDGLYLMNEEGIRKIAEGSVSSILIYQDTLFYGGGYGLFESKDRGKSSSKLFQGEVLDIAFSDRLVIAAKSGCWRLDEGWKRIFFVSYSDDEDDEEDEEDKEEICLQVACDKEKIFFSKGERLFVTEDGGVSWDRVQVPLSPIKQLILSSDSLYIAQEGGVYRLTKEGLLRLSGLTYRVIDASLHSSLLVATKGGIFELKAESDTKEVSMPDEPDYLEVQQMAIRYAEVGPEKIAKWRRSAECKALLPDFSLQYSNTISSYQTTIKDFAVGPKDWSLSLSWNLDELIYSSDQTTIDSRSKLMVDLRNDILDEVNRIYFERKRLLAELPGEKDSSKKLTKELLIEELTARLDGFTGGGFSRGTKINHRDHRELKW
jgi:hypothetical protein